MRRYRALLCMFIVVFAAALLVSRCGGDGTRPSGSDAEATTTTVPGAAVVVGAVDGDTLKVEVAGRKETVRLIGIDTPETKDPRRPVECFGREAAARLAALLPDGTPVRLVRDVELRDRYGRVLAYVYRLDDDLFVNLTLVREGYAAAATYPPNVAHTEAFVDAARRARQEQRGLWNTCGGIDVPAQ